MLLLIFRKGFLPQICFDLFRSSHTFNHKVGQSTLVAVHCLLSITTPPESGYPNRQRGFKVGIVGLRDAHSDALLVCCDMRLRNWQALIASRSRSPGHSKAQDATAGDRAASSYQPRPCSWSGDDVYTWQMLFRSDTDI